MTDTSTTDTKPPSIAAMRANATEIRDQINNDLMEARKDRDRLNIKIKRLVADQKEADSAVRALTPKTRTAKK